MTEKHTLTHEDLKGFIGDFERYRHPLVRRVIYTPGVKFIAEHGGAYWLIDELAFYLADPAFKHACKRDPRIGQIHFWTLKVADQQGTLAARADSDVKPFYTKQIEYTDFPLDRIDIWAAYDRENWTLYLSSEH